jgi:signal transduction histidine kinase
VVLGLLREDELTSADLSPAPRLVDLKELADTVRAAGTPVDLRMSGDQQLSPALELSIYRVVQEALTNVVKHAPRARASVAVDIRESEVGIEITDDGNGTVAARARRAVPGLGIVGMRERVGAFGGTLSAGRLAQGGFRVLARIPVERSA